MAGRSLATTGKSLYASGARRLRAALQHAPGERADAPPAPDLRARHYLRSLLAVYDAEALVELAVPWWSYRSIDVVDAWLAGRGGDARCFEFGAGASTVWLADRCAEVVSVEHDEAFAETVKTFVAGRDNVDLRAVPGTPSASPSVRSGRSGFEGLDFTDYVSEIERAGEFDLVVVDGRARADALARAVACLRPRGIIVFDNADRARYQQALAATGLPIRRLRGLTPSLPYPSTTAILGGGRARPAPEVRY